MLSAGAGSGEEIESPVDGGLHCAARLAFLPSFSFLPLLPSLPFIPTLLVYLFSFLLFSETRQTLYIAYSGIETQGGHTFSGLYTQARPQH